LWRTKDGNKSIVPCVRSMGRESTEVWIMKSPPYDMCSNVTRHRRIDCTTNLVAVFWAELDRN